MADLDVAVVGAGIAGLATAYRLRAAGREPQVFEALDAVGGRMRTRRHGGYIIDEGTETIAAKGYPATWELIRELGLVRSEVLPVRSYVGLWRRGRVHPGVGHPRGAITGAGLSPRGRLDLTRITASVLARARRYDVDRPEDTPLGTRTVAEFARDHPPEILDYLLQPAVATAFGWHPERSCMGPLVATMLATRGIVGWRTYRDGMDTLARRLAEHVPVRTGSRVAAVTSTPGAARLEFTDGGLVTARSVVLAVPAPVATAIHLDMPADERSFVDACTYVPMIRVTCLLDRPLEPPRRRLDPPIYALLVPERENATLAGLTVEHNKAANRAPDGAGLVSLLPTPTRAAELVDAGDDEVTRVLLGSAEEFLPGVGTASTRAFVHRFRHGAPEATPAALVLRRDFTRRRRRRVDYAGEWLSLRPSSEGAVRSAGVATRRILDTEPQPGRGVEAR